MDISPAEALLSSMKLLRRCRDDGGLRMLVDMKELKSAIFIELRSQNPDKPDYSYKKLIDLFFESESESESSYSFNSGSTSGFSPASSPGSASTSASVSASKDSLNGYLMKSFKKITERFVYFRSERIYINSDNFEDWQDLISKLPPLPIIAYSIYDKCKAYEYGNNYKRSFDYFTVKFVGDILNNSALPSIYEPEIEDFISSKGLTEIHLHLSGTTESDFVWQNALSHPAKFYQNIKRLYRSGSDKKIEMSEQYAQLGDFKYDDVFNLVKTASSVRDLLIGMINGDKYYGYCNDSGNGNDNGNFLNPRFLDAIKAKPHDYADKIHPYRKIEDRIGDSKFCENDYENKFKKFNSIQYEALFLIRAFRHLEYNRDYRFAPLFYYYLLIYSFCNRLLAQQKDSTGFEQFLKVSDNKLREFSETHYTERFKQLRGMYGQDLVTLEGRFAPKKNLQDNLKILRSIIKDYQNFNKYGNGNNNGRNYNGSSNNGNIGNNNNESLRYDLSLIAHFIKEKDIIRPEIAPFRDIKLRTKIAKNFNYLNSSLRLVKNGKDFFCGFDAANNEMYASPEVFAPVFRKARFFGFDKFTFHAGEDFVHLLSGIRAVYEAMDFLELGIGDRIGHTTALGIEPALWLDRIGSTVIIEKGEWLDDLVFAYYLINSINSYDYQNLNPLNSLNPLNPLNALNAINSLNFVISEKIKELFYDIYVDYRKYCGHDKIINVKDLIKAWKLRKLDPELSFGEMHYHMFDEFKNLELKNIFKHRYEKYAYNYSNYTGGSFGNFKDYFTDEVLENKINLFKIFKAANLNCLKEKKDFEIFRSYHDKKTIKESRKHIEVKTDEIFNKDVLKIFQNTVTKKLIEKRIAVETLPTSNLRISFYKNYGEHHIFRWLGANKTSADPKPIVCLGSDDTGIFSTNLRNEFSHIFCSLISKKIDRKQALDFLKEVAENNRIYGFKNV